MVGILSNVKVYLEIMGFMTSQHTYHQGNCMVDKIEGMGLKIMGVRYRRQLASISTDEITLIESKDTSLVIDHDFNVLS